MKVICVNPQSDPLWQRLIRQFRSDAFHSPEWMKVLTETYGFEDRAYVLVDDLGEPKAGIPFCRIEDIKGKRIVSIPFSDYCDPLVKTSRQWETLLNTLLKQQCSLAFRCLHNNIPLSDKRFNLVNKAKWNGIDLKPELNVLWQSLDSSARRAIRKAQNSGVIVHNAKDKKELRKFFEMHLGVRKYKYRMLAQPYKFFEHIWEMFVVPENGFLLVAKYDEELIAGIFFLEWQGRLYYKFNASSPEYLHIRPNDRIIWEAIKIAKERGCTFLDLGLTDWDQDGLVRYKQKFSSEEKTIYYLRHIPDHMSKINAQYSGNLLSQLTDLFTCKSVPDHITEQAGQLLYRYFA